MKPSENLLSNLGYIGVAAIVLWLVGNAVSFYSYGAAAYFFLSLVFLALIQYPKGHHAFLSAALFGLAVTILPFNLELGVTFPAVCAFLLAGFSLRASGHARLIFCSLALAIWIAILGRASGPEGGADPLREFLMRYMPSEASAEFAVIAIRKSIHFLFYGIMAAMAYIAQDRDLRSAKTMMTVSLFVVLCEAILDEIRQSQFANRTGSAWDVVIDLAGAVFALWLMNRRDKKPTESVDS